MKSTCFFVFLTVLTLLTVLGISDAARTGKPSAPCGPGKYRSWSSGKCEPCAPGTYNWLPHARACTPCPANTYTPYTGVVDSSLCLSCPLDSYSTPGSTSCTRCATGSIRNPLLSSSSSSSSYSSYYYRYNSYKRSPKPLPTCVKCTSTDCACAATEKGCPLVVKECKRKGFILPPAGVSYFADSVCVSATTGCPGNLQLRAFVRRAICENPTTGRVVCPAGFLFDGVDRCVRCEPGARLVHKPDSDRKVTCEYCPGNSVSPGGLSTKCTPCPCGYAKTADLSSCFNTIPEGVEFSCD